jgi:hypothetical protein
VTKPALTIEHLGYLWESELITSPVTALGAMPTTRLTLAADQANSDLRAHGIITDSEAGENVPVRFTPFGSLIFSTLISPDESWWGLILLRGQARDETIAVPQEWERYGLHENILTIPRVHFAVSYAAENCVVAVRSGGHVSFMLIPARNPRATQVVELLTQILDPGHRWKPAEFAEIVVPHDVTADLATGAPTGDDIIDTQVRSARRGAYARRGVTGPDIERFLALIEDTSNTAAEMQVLHTVQPNRTTPSAVSITLIYGLGSLVIYPITGTDRQPWLRFATASPKHLRRAIETVAGLPHFEFNYNL